MANIDRRGGRSRLFQHVECTRCTVRSGRYVVAGRDLGICYGCGGKGFRRERAGRLAARERDESLAALKQAALETVRAEFNAIYGMDLTTPLGLELLNLEVMRSTGRSLVVHADERLARAMPTPTVVCRQRGRR